MHQTREFSMTQHTRNDENGISPHQRLEEMGITLQAPGAPLAAYVPVVRTENLLFVSGQLPMDDNGVVRGCLGKDTDVEAAQEAARLAAISILAQVEHTAKIPLKDISRFVKLSVFVASTPDFSHHHLVANGASEFIARIFGEKGKHARAAFGVAALPMGAVVEIEAVLEVGN